MKSQTLQFEIVDLLQFFTVEFESESRSRNRLMEVEFKGFKLDTVELRGTHPLLYSKIKAEMQSIANAYWNEEEGIKTLDAKQFDYMAEIKKVLFPVIIFLLLPFLSFSQDTIHVKKVFINGQVIKVYSGYIIHDAGKWIVNGKTVKLHRYKKTDLESFKKQELLIVKR